MSIGVGTLQPKVRIRRPVLLAGLVAVVAVFTMSVMGANSTDQSAPVTAVGRANANTPTELSGGIVGFQYAGIAVNTPSEMRGGYIGGVADVDFEAVPHVPRRAPLDGSYGGSLGVNTPSEIGGHTDSCPQCR
jgi:hypothetical protein